LKWFLVYLISSLAYNAFSDTIRNQTFTKPLVLNRSVFWYIENCTFKVQSKEAGLVVSSPVQIKNCTFLDCSAGILFKSKGHKAVELNVSGNHFSNCKAGVEIQSGLASLKLKCNVFECTSNQHQIGLRIGKRGRLSQNRIGGSFQSSIPETPNGNLFPYQVDSLGNHIPISGYYSIWNESPFSISYFSYSNEMPGQIYPSKGESIVFICQTDLKLFTRKNMEQMKPNGDQGDLEIQNPNWVLACDGGPLDYVAFPISRPTPSSLVAEMVESLTIDKVYLGQSIPNPAQSLVTIPVLLTELKGSAVLEIFEMATGKAIDQKIISGFGQHNVYFNVHTWASGIYGYRIVLPDGKSPAPRKMVLLK
jgi:hypothetical protein